MKSFCVIGLGKFGVALARTLAEDGKQVMIIDIDEDRVNSLADTVTHALVGDPTNEGVLRSAGICDYDCVIVALADNVNNNILLTIMLKEMGVKNLIVRAISDGHKKVLEKIGADMIVFPERDTGERLAVTLGRDNVTDYMEFSGYSLAEIIVPAGWVGKDLIKLGIRNRYHVNVIAVKHSDGRVDVPPDPNKAFEKGDRITVVGDDKAIEKCMRSIN